MTRETKIGLLVGLGFIVVFAVLLSHTTPMPPAGDGLTVEALRLQGQGPGQGAGERTVEDRLALAPGATGQMGAGQTAPNGEPLATGRTGESGGLDGGSIRTVALPRVGVLEPKPVRPPLASTGQSEPSGHAMNTDTGAVAVVEYPRIAPPIGEPIAEPHPTARPAGPQVSPSPDHPSPPEQGAPAPSGPPRRYVVRAGESLVKIAKARYGTAHPWVLDYLVDLNKPEIKDRNRVYQGQELVVPDLPPELFAKVPNLALAKVTSGAQPVTLEKLVGGAGERRAPTPAKEPAQVSAESKAKKPDGPAGKGEDQTKGSEKAARWYEVQSGETYTSIARKELGSTGLWKEIQRLNEKADPAKLRPGDRILLPNKPMPEPFKPKRIPA